MRSLLWIVPLACLSACQPLAILRMDSSVPLKERVDDESCWLEEWHRVIALPEDQLVLVLNTRVFELEQSPNPGTRLRLALLLAEGPQPVRDQARALKLLTEFDAGQASASEQALAAFLKQVIAEQQWSRDRIAGLNQELKDSRTRVEELESQLRELTTIEQNIQQRELPGSRKE